MNLPNGTEEKIKKAKRKLEYSFGFAIAFAVMYVLFAGQIPTNDPFYQTILIPLTLGLAVGLVFFGGSVLANFQSTKKLIVIEDKLDILNKKLSDSD